MGSQQLPCHVEEQNEAQSRHLTTKQQSRGSALWSDMRPRNATWRSYPQHFTHSLTIPWGPSGATPPRAAGSHPGHTMGYTPEAGAGGRWRGERTVSCREWSKDCPEARDKKEAWSGQGVMAIQSLGPGGRKAT